MSQIKMIMHGIKGIDHGIIDLPLENGVFAIVGNNGCGKSTIMSCLAQLLSRHNLGLLKKEDFNKDSFVEFFADGLKDHWYSNNINFWVTDTFPNTTIRYNGTYEGSLFYGVRFKDSKIVDQMMEEGKIFPHDLADADDYIHKQLGLILHNQENYYAGLKRIRNKDIATRLNLSNTPYFREVNGELISQYRMSSGECMLISLLHFIYNSIIRRSLPTRLPILMLIDEIELALHPIAISNLIDLLSSLTKEYQNMTVILTTHSPEVIRKINPQNVYKIERSNDPENNFFIVNPCYPSYAIRDIYTHDGFDFLLLVEDELAKSVVKKSISDLKLSNSRLINVLPVGGWNNVLKLQYEIISNNILGVNKKVFSILDGDVVSLIPKDYSNLQKYFLPISSVEKYLYNILIVNPNQPIKKSINDRFFTIQSIDVLILEYRTNEAKSKRDLGSDYREDKDGKRLYGKISRYLDNHKVSSSEFISGLHDIINKNVDFAKFNENLNKALTAW